MALRSFSPKVRVVSGYVPLKNQPRPHEEYVKLGLRFSEMGAKLEQPIMAWHGDLPDCWLATYLVDTMKQDQIKCAVADNPAKNTVAYHCVQHQKFEWLQLSSAADTDSDVFVWIDYGIFSVPGVTEEAILKMVDRARHETSISIPGCWDKPGDPGDDTPNWRFCGGLIVCPKRYLFEMDVAVKAETLRHLKETNKLTWEVNTLARVELKNELPIWWYGADHDGSMFANYPLNTVGSH